VTSVVSLVRAQSDRTQAVEHALDLLGSPLDALQPGTRVLIKPNMFQLKPGFQSHPDIVCALARLAKARGATVTVAERTRNLHQLLSSSGVAKYAEIVSLDDARLRVTQIEGATSLRVPLAIPEPVLECDYFIGVPQLRTHASVLVTNGLKNLVGLLPGYTTRIVHMAGVDESIVDLNVLRPQQLVVSDATTVVEGNYPMDGDLREVGVLGASTDAVALDSVMASMAGFDSTEVVYLRLAQQRGLGVADLERIRVVGLTRAEAAFPMRQAPCVPTSTHPGVRIYAESACVPCQRYIAAAMKLLEPELREFQGELTIVSGPLRELPELRGQVVLVGNSTYEHRERGIFVEGCPPRAIQIAAFRYALGHEVTPEQRSQFRVPSAVGVS